MQKIRAIIVDDEDQARQIIRLLVKDDLEVEVVAEYNNGQDAIAGIVEHRPDIVFLDIQMPELNGFQVVESVPEGIQPQYIFITAYDEYAVQAFEVNAIDYVLKPYDDDRFYTALNRAKQQLGDAGLSLKMTKLLQSLKDQSKDQLRRIVVREGSKVKFIQVNEIIWIEAADQYCKLHTKDGEHLIRESMRYYEQNLDPNSFFRSHRSSIVNLSYVKELQLYKKGSYIIILHDGQTLELGPDRVEKLKRAISHSRYS